MNLFNRRSLLGYSLFGAGAALAGGPAAAQAPTWNPYARDGGEKWIIDNTSAVANTDSGQVMGYIRNDVRIFQGIPYAEVLSPEARWQRGAKVRPWTGKRTSRSQGPSCPPDTPYHIDTLMSGETWDEFQLRDNDIQPWRSGEDCLRVNVWTPALDNKKRPVLFWCHGGGFHNGFALMEARYGGHNLAKYGDVVVVSMNHRLNAFGFLDLTAYGARYAESANLGMLDIVDALKWVKTNIANFGGDPGNVMVFGQSGGGSKVAALLCMPEAKGLFHRAVIQSAGGMPFSTPAESAALTAAFLKAAEVSPGNIDALHKIPMETIARLAGATTGSSNPGRLAGSTRAMEWQPVVDGKALAFDPLSPTGPSEVPVMIGSNLHENFIALGHPEYMQMPEPQARALVRASYDGPMGDAIYDIYKSIFPKANPFAVSATARDLARHRAASVKFAQIRAATKGAPTYNYWFHWQSEMFDGRAMSHHELELALIFLNSDAAPGATGATAAARALSLKMADTWLAFARTGNPNNPSVPKWDPVTPNSVSSMVFDNICRIDHGSDLAAIELYWKNRPQG